jgi:Periplasmic binding protein
VRVGACLSLTGRYARFGAQAAAGLEAWRRLDGRADLVVEDDASDPGRLAAAIVELAGRCDLLLGPYSTQLMRAAVRALAGRDVLLWNHGGSGDDVEAARPGRVVSVPAPASRYAEPFLRRLAREPARAPLHIAAGRGTFGPQVAAGGGAFARRLGLVVREDAPGAGDAAWDLLSAGAFEDDVAAVRRALALPRPPRYLCSVAAGVSEFGRAVERPEGVFGVAQWFPGAGGAVEVGPAEAEFLAACPARDYPAVQAAAAAALASRCAELAGTVAAEALWAVASALDTTTMLGRFRIDGRGVQVGHETVLVRWTAAGPERVPR